MQDIREADWKVFREIRQLALERFCNAALADVGRIALETGKGAHERYLAVCKLLQERDEELEVAFDCLRRSTSVRQLAAFRFRGLVTDEEFGRFSDETRASVQAWLEG